MSANIKYQQNVDLGFNQLLNALLENVSTFPTSNLFQGRAIYNTTTQSAYFWNGAKWRPFDASLLTDGSISIAALSVDPTQRANHQGTQLAATISNLQATVLAYTLDSFAVPVNSVNLNGQRLVSGAQAQVGTDIPRWDQVQAYVIAQVAGQAAVKLPVRVCAAAAVTATGTQTIDGVALNVGDRVLRTGEASTVNNGIFVVAAGAWTLAPDTTAAGSLIEGSDVLVNEGSTYAGSIFRLTTTGTITAGTTGQTWIQTAKINTYTGDGTTITLSGNVFSVKTQANGGITSGAGGLIVDTTVGRKYAGTITGDGATTSFALTHNLNNSNPTVVVRDSGGVRNYVGETATSANAVTLSFGIAPANGAAFSVSISG